MPKSSFFSHPYLLGFEQLERMLERTANSSDDGYPPYNIEQPKDDRFRISLAVAGFSIDELSAVIDGSQLIIRGEKHNRVEPVEYIHQGIAGRQFQRTFVLAEGIEIVKATHENGLLHLDLVRVAPENVVQKIAINSGT